MENTQETQLNKELTIDSNEINVSNRKNSTLYVYICKKVLEKYNSVVLNALGNATSIAVIAAENLVRNGYAEYVKLETKTIDVEQNRRGRDAKEGEEGRTRQKAKLLITLSKSKNFDENMQKFNEIRDENQKHIEAERVTRAAKAESQ